MRAGCHRKRHPLVVKRQLIALDDLIAELWPADHDGIPTALTQRAASVIGGAPLHLDTHVFLLESYVGHVSLPCHVHLPGSWWRPNSSECGSGSFAVKCCYFSRFAAESTSEPFIAGVIWLASRQ